jgi:hypothetical protein
MSTRVIFDRIGGMVNGMFANQNEINGVNGALTIVLPLAGGEEFEGGVVVTERLPDIRNVACQPKENRDMKKGGC